MRHALRAKVEEGHQGERDPLSTFDSRLSTRSFAATSSAVDSSARGEASPCQVGFESRRSSVQLKIPVS